MIQNQIDYKNVLSKTITKMDYSQFFYDSLLIILEAFQDYIPKDYINVLKKKYEQITKPSRSVYVEIFAFSGNTKVKIEQWKFKPKNEATTQPHLQRSYSHSNSNSDSQLSFSQLNQPSFFKTLQTIRKNIQPRLLLKKLQRPKIICQIKNTEQQLTAFNSGNTFYFEVAEYESEMFEVKLSFKYNYQDEVVAMEMKEIKGMKESDSDDFELLVDESFEKKLKGEFSLEDQGNKENTRQHQLTLHPKDHIKQSQRKLSQIITSSKIIFSSPKQQLSESQKHLKLRRQQDFIQIDRLYRNIDFSTVESTKLKTFLEYLL